MSDTLPPRRDCTIVIPVYYNQGLLWSTYRAIKEKVIDGSGRDVDVVFIDDGSGDRSLEELMEIRRSDPARVTVIKLTRNFGQVSALLAGFCHTRSRSVVAISADGQDPPELIVKMLDEHFNGGSEIVACARKGRDESAYRILTSKIFYWLMRKLSFPHMPLGGFDFVLLGRKAVDALIRNREQHSFFQGQILWTGFSIKFIEYRRMDRELGKSRWTFGKKLTYLIDGVIGYSYFPIRFIAFAGVVVALLGLLYAGAIFVLKLFGGIPVQGWAPLMIMVLVMGGFQMIMLGIIGEYLWRALAQVRNRDLYIVETVHEGPAD